MIYALYIASAFGAVSLLLMMPRRGFTPVALGVVLGALALGGFWLYLARQMPATLGLESAALGYYYVFSAIAIFAAARVITHTRPVFAALWFIMVVLAAAGLLLTLSAEFIAAAIVIIYGGAILVTYVFVIMLAAPASASAAQAAGHYDRVAREPVAAVIVGHLLLATLLTVFFEPMTPNLAGAADDKADAVVEEVLTKRPAQRLADRLVDGGQEAPQALEAELEQVDNVERVGLDLFRSHPLGIELAGVILLVALVGAVVIARQSTRWTTEDEPEQDLEGVP